MKIKTKKKYKALMVAKETHQKMKEAAVKRGMSIDQYVNLLWEAALKNQK